MVDIRFLHHIEELARIGRQAFDIAALAFGIDRIKRKAGFARTRQAGDDHQLVARDVDVDILQIMLARTANLDVFQLGHACPQFIRGQM